MDLLDWSENAGSDELDPLAEAILGGPLVAHLGAEFFSAASVRMKRASSTDHVSGFWQKQCLPRRMAIALAGGV